MMLGSIVDSEKVADAVLTDLHAVFGTRVFDTLVAMMVENHLGGEMDIRTAIMQRPDLFERAFIGILGEVGERILASVCNNTLPLMRQAELPRDGTNNDDDSSNVVAYSKAGDFAKYISAATTISR